MKAGIFMSATDPHAAHVRTRVRTLILNPCMLSLQYRKLKD